MAKVSLYLQTKRLFIVESSSRLPDHVKMGIWMETGFIISLPADVVTLMQSSVKQV